MAPKKNTARKEKPPERQKTTESFETSADNESSKHNDNVDLSITNDVSLITSPSLAPIKGDESPTKLSESPTKVSDHSEHTPTKDYRLLYHEAKRKLIAQAEKSKKRETELKQQFEAKGIELGSLSKTNSMLQDEIRQLTMKIEDLETKCQTNDKCATCNNSEEIKEVNNKLSAEINLKSQELDRVKDEVTKHMTDGKLLKQKIKSLEKENSDKEVMVKAQLGTITQLREKSKVVNEGVANIDIESTLKVFSSDILTKVTEMMDAKLSVLKLKPNNESRENENPTPGVTWSNVVSQSSNMKTVMRAARNEEKIEESEKLRRANNIIIHGAEEIGKTPEEIKQADDGYIKEIFTKIGTKVSPTSISRLGAPKEDGNRPIKLVMKTKEDKDKVMSNLGRLKNTERYFGKISLKDDYTASEREQIRLLTVEASKKRAEKPERDFRVRGDAKNGWRIVSFPRK